MSILPKGYGLLGYAMGVAFILGVDVAFVTGVEPLTLRSDESPRHESAKMQSSDVNTRVKGLELRLRLGLGLGSGLG